MNTVETTLYRDARVTKMVSARAPELASYKRVVTSTDLVQADIYDLFFRLLFQTHLKILNWRRLHWPVSCPLPSR